LILVKPPALQNTRVVIAPSFALSGASRRSDRRTQMNRGPSRLQPEDLVEPLDIDIDTLDHALMELVTSDWQTLDDGEPPGKADDPQGEQAAA
jgi:hypothetical protein